MNLPLPKLLKWLISRFLFLSLFGFIVGLVCFFIFFKNHTLSDFILIFLLGFAFCGLIFLLLFLHLFHSLDRIFARIQDIKKGRKSIYTEKEPYLDEEPGELYEFNKSLNQISNYLKWQKNILSQESSELEAVISALTGAILAVNQNKKVLFFNNQATSLFSPQRSSQQKHLSLSEMIRSPDILHAYEDCLQKAQVIKKTLSIGALGAEDESFIYEITVTPLKKAGQVYGAVGLFYNITNIKNRDKVQLDFITNVSHELRTPLTAIQGYVETLLEDMNTNSKEQIKHFLSIIKRNTQRLVSLLNHFLELSQIEEPKEIKKETLNTEEITQSTVKDLHIKKPEVRMDFAQKTVKANRLLLKQILYNLIDNAVKYAPQSPWIEVLWSKQNNFVLLTVKDYGRGISSRHKSRLFEKFYRVDPSRKQIKGAGIGLAIVKQFIEKHEGSIEVKSSPQEGSSFICAFPD